MSKQRNYDEIREELISEYKRIISQNSKYEECIKQTATEGSDSKLSSLFLPDIPHDYLNSNKRLMVIGRETRGWDIRHIYNGTDIDSYIEAAMVLHKSHYEKASKNEKSQKSVFWDYLRSVNKVTQKDLIWSNIFCFDWKKGDPKKAPNNLFDNLIKPLSDELLKAQIKTLKPTYIIFANGIKLSGF